MTLFRDTRIIISRLFISDIYVSLFPRFHLAIPRPGYSDSEVIAATDHLSGFHGVVSDSTDHRSFEVTDRS
jgi:hypothetical protein